MFSVCGTSWSRTRDHQIFNLALYLPELHYHAYAFTVRLTHTHSKMRGYIDS